MLTSAVLTDFPTDFATDVRLALTKSGQKELPSKYLYDGVGSKLFEVISEIPEYGLTRADERLLRTHAHEIVQHVHGDVIVCELGSGSGRKTRWILEALSRRRPTLYYPIEISPVALALCQRELADIECLGIVGLEREYLDGLQEVVGRRSSGQRILVLFLGSTIGNFSPPADLGFLREVRLILGTGDALLLGTDLDKPVAQLLAAYDDPLGITAAFNLNLLARINRELGANFVLRDFEHVARFNSRTRSVEMYLRSKRHQTVTFPDYSVTFLKGESIWTENSHKYNQAEIHHIASTAGFRCEAQWIDDQWPFAETLLVAE